MIEELQVSDFKLVYRLMKQSFPLDEYRPLEEQRALLKNPSYTVYVRYHEMQGIQAFAAVWHFAEFAFIEHIAVNPNFRNEGIGGEFLQDVLNKFSVPVILEVEPPETDVAFRRIGFYERSGFHLNDYSYTQPPIAAGKNPIPLLLMSSGSKLSHAQFDAVKSTLYREVYRCAEDAY